MSTPEPLATPILIIIFNRPDKVRALLAALLPHKPKKLYIGADGPRTNRTDDARLCEEARKIATEVSWPCEVTTLFQTKNLGCKMGATTAISWFFEHEEEGIILEDDCIPNGTFLSFAAAMLERYRHEDKVMQINGTTFLTFNELPPHPTAYYFSKIPLMWGWASWRRAWQHNDLAMPNLANLFSMLRHDNAFMTRQHAYFWYNLCRHIQKNDIDTWDAQWVYSVYNNKGLCITPATNTIENIGFDTEATHTTERIAIAQSYSNAESSLPEPSPITVHHEFDRRLMNKAFTDTPFKHFKFFIKSLLRV
ncbi:nucleotide-diphospho-sugar transferase [Patescibacteria group bacterium]|nr:nucleotide-diphospho-sugar transferase [Patescibacteria group bacterium]